MYSDNKYLGAVFMVHFQSIIVLTGPMLFFYVRGILNDDHKLYKKDWLHFIPSILYLINTSRYLFYSIGYKLSFAEKVIKSRMMMLEFDPVLFSGNIAYILRSLLAIGYTTACVFLIYNHFKDDIRRHLQNKIIFRWLSILLIFNYIMNFNIFFYVIKLLYNWNYNFGFTVVPIGALYFGIFSLLVINCILFFFPVILYGLPRMDYSIAVPHQNLEEAIESVVTRRQTKDFEISDDKLALIEQKLEIYKVNFPYLQPQFSLSVLSNDTGIPSHHLSYFFKIYLKTDFTNWKNNARIDYVINLIKTGETDKLTLDAISKKAGFVSRSTFISSFKLRTGLTPSEFIETLS
jgi:AraC-like DNA-binding protein